ncbi:MAG: prepilin-type N-terminal cleavage/methylation domain-containing protein [Planctomycetota bacterium]
MSRAAPQPKRDVRLRAGFSLIELMVSSVVLMMLIYIVVTLTQTGTQAQRYSQRLTRVTEIAQDLSDEIRREVMSSVRLFQNDTEGNTYVGLLDLSASAPGITYRLPAIEESGIFRQEVGSETKSGNALLFARHAWTTVFTPTASTRTYRIDVYRMTHYYPSPEDGGPKSGDYGGLNLVKWVSEPLADGDQIDKISDVGDRTSVLQHLKQRTADDDGQVHPAVEVVWLRNGDPAATGTLRHIQSTGTLFDDPQAPRTSPWQLLRSPKFSSDSLLYLRHHSLASVFAPPGWGVGSFSQVSTTGDGFPHGFEIQMIGPAAARQVLLRLVVTSTNRDGHPARSTIQTIVDAREI